MIETCPMLTVFGEVKTCARIMLTMTLAMTSMMTMTMQPMIIMMTMQRIIITVTMQTVITTICHLPSPAWQIEARLNGSRIFWIHFAAAVSCYLPRSHLIRYLSQYYNVFVVIGKCICPNRKLDSGLGVNHRVYFK